MDAADSGEDVKRTFDSRFQTHSLPGHLFERVRSIEEEKKVEEEKHEPVGATFKSCFFTELAVTQSLVCCRYVCFV